MWWLWIALAGAGEPEVVCPDESRAALLEAAGEVERAWMALDGPGFDVARHRLDALVGCVDETLVVADAVQVHRARGLVAFVDGDLEAAQRAYRAVHALAPGWSLDPERVPREHPLWAVVEAAAGSTDVSVLTLQATPRYGWLVDGTRHPREGAPTDAAGQPTEPLSLPGDRAFVLQVLGEEAVVYTGYHLSAAEIPVKDLRMLVDPEAVRAQRRRQARIWGSVVGGTLLTAGAVSFGLGWDERAQVAGLSEPTDAELAGVEGRQAKANTLGAVGYGLAGAGALSLTLAWSVPW